MDELKTVNVKGYEVLDSYWIINFIWWCTVNKVEEIYENLES